MLIMSTKVTYICHSGFVCEGEQAVVVVDYWKDASDNRLHELLSTTEKQIYFLVSHFHQDHYNSEILEFQRPEGYETPHPIPFAQSTPVIADSTAEAENPEGETPITENSEVENSEADLSATKNPATEDPKIESPDAAQPDAELTADSEPSEEETAALSEPSAALSEPDVTTSTEPVDTLPPLPKVPRLLLSYDTVRHHRIPKAMPTAILRPGDHYEDESLKLTVYRSTDVGVSFIIEFAEGDTLFHAGDLNNWYFADVDQRIKMSAHEMEGLFLSALRDIQMGHPHFTHVMFPIDPRLGKNALRGPSQWLTRFETDNFYPMHYWAQHEMIADAVKELEYLFPHTSFHYSPIPDEALLYGELLEQVLHPAETEGAKKEEETLSSDNSE